ncbi:MULTISPECIES: SsgA family sporulation/cell division regulator [unclassified Streptomyces]|uniref:SsgA family sporulation/cell division regulator n=1 Tax=unclassified Streptomyces TaxID=2593676 RepID=UPI0028C41476|nr:MULTISPECIES: SsgA family sporulation/cell division regulator [unclassified Streptomyces]WNO71384.1 SsgA family sporulation/cell division regulator [Streptomyces sp. AM8-1-1]
MSPTVEQSVPAHLISDAPQPAPMPVTLSYRADDPLAVRMVFPAAVSLSGATVTWTFARSLLDAGLHTPSGTGDVHVWPCGRTQTMVELRSPEGVALLRFATGRLRHFLLHSYATVPVELETRAIDMDSGLASLLGEARG